MTFIIVGLFVIITVISLVEFHRQNKNQNKKKDEDENDET
jgi:preprotein translocase subunit SecG